MEERTAAKMNEEVFMRYLAAESAYDAVAGAASKELDANGTIMEERSKEVEAILNGRKTDTFEAIEEFANATLALVIAKNPEALLPSTLGTIGLREIATIRMWAHMQMEGALDVLHSRNHAASCDRQKVLSHCLIRWRDYLNVSLDLVLMGRELLLASRPGGFRSAPTRH